MENSETRGFVSISAGEEIDYGSMFDNIAEESIADLILMRTK